MKRNALVRRYLSIDTYFEILREEWTLQRFLPDILLKTIAYIVVSLYKFIKDACVLSASALTFYSVLSVIPIVALLLAVARGFGMDKLLENEIKSQTFTDPALAEWLVHFANQALNNTNGGLVTGIGIVILIWAVVRVLSSTELTMNRIWGVRKGRGLVRKFTDYMSIMFIAPIFLLLISSSNVFFSSNLQSLASEDGLWRYAGTVYGFVVSCLPYVLVWLLFVFIYMFMPNTPIKFSYALISGMVAGTVFQVVQWFYIKFQIGVTSYNAIYGSLAALPLMLVWLQLSWSIILWGTELCYVLRNHSVLYPDPENPGNPWTIHVDIAVDVLNYIASEFMEGRGGPSLEMISNKLKLSTSKLRIVLQDLVDKRILAEVREDADVFYYPAMDFNKLTMSSLISKVSELDVKKDSVWRRRLIKVIETEFSQDHFVQK